MYREISDLGLFVQTSPYGLGLHSTDLALRARSAQKRPWSDISLYKPRVRLIRSYYTGQIHQFYQINCMFSRYKWKYSSRKRAHCKNHTAMSACKHGCIKNQLRDRSFFIRRRGVVVFAQRSQENTVTNLVKLPPLVRARFVSGHLTQNG
jgi:hypothetical protein